MRDSTQFKKTLNILMPVLSVIVIYLIFLIFYYVKDNSLAFPHPNDILEKTFELLKEKSTYKAIGLSLFRLVFCIVVSFLLGFILALLSYLSTYFKKFINPYILIFRTIPLASIIVLFIIMFGTSKSCYIITCLVIVPIIYENIYQGFLNMPKEVIEACKIDSNFNLRILFRIYIPFIASYIKASLIECIGLGFKVLVMAEFLSGKNYSIGYSLQDAYQNHIEMVYVYAWTVILVVLSVAITKVTDLFKTKDKVIKIENMS